MLTHLVYFEPLAVPSDVARELASHDPYGERIKLEIKLLKQYCPVPIGTKQKRDAFPIIMDVREMGQREFEYFNSMVITQELIKGLQNDT